jgi:Protein of unknown function (DUF1569)
MRTLARERDKTDVFRRLRQVRPDSARRWGRMSAHQMICHLSDATLMAMDQKPVSPATTVLQRTIVKWIALFLPVPWPPGIVTRPEIDQFVAGTCPTDFAADVTALIALVERFVARERDAIWPAHPIFGRLSRMSWLRWGYLHMDHHLRQFGV